MMSRPQLLISDPTIMGGVVASSTLDGYPASNLADNRTTTFWRSANTADQYLTISTTAVINAIGLAGHNFTGATVLVQVSNDGFVSDVVTCTTFLVMSTDPVLKTFTSVAGKTACRVKISGLTAAAALAILALGSYVEFDHPIEDDYAPADQTVNTSLPTNTGGNNTSNVGQLVQPHYLFSALKTDITFPLVGDTWWRVVFQPLWRSWLGLGMPFFWKPSPDIFPDDSYLYRVDDGFTISPKHWGLGYRQLQMTFVGVGNIQDRAVIELIRIDSDTPCSTENLLVVRVDFNLPLDNTNRGLVHADIMMRMESLSPATSSLITIPISNAAVVVGDIRMNDSWQQLTSSDMRINFSESLKTYTDLILNNDYRVADTSFSFVELLLHMDA